MRKRSPARSLGSVVLLSSILLLSAAAPSVQAREKKGYKVSPTVNHARYRSADVRQSGYARADVDAATPVRPLKPLAERMYAVDGRSFFANGQRVQVMGMDGPEFGHPASGVAKQKLQQMLDTGEVSIEPQGTDSAGNLLARVRIGGRDLLDMLRGEPESTRAE
ncbi:MAG: hypothetical protein KF778_08400 [Rhodocyclaceae bacterium]|nr:hypothetical protein [Rhodocyclaceae bacterium]MBX3668407.1 hypothetical protein [Rhodocyclaceae bacterium]